MIKYCLIWVIMVTALVAQDNPGWKSLPAEAIAAIKFDFSEEVLADIQANTKLGQQVLSAERFRQFTAILKEHSLTNPKLAFVMAELRSAGFSVSELLEVFQAKIGMALVPKRYNQKEYWSFLAWAELKEGLSQKIFLQLKEKASGEVISFDGHEALQFKEDKKDSSSIIFNIDNRLFLIASDIDKKHKTSETKKDLKKSQNPNAERKFISTLCKDVAATYFAKYMSKDKKAKGLPMSSEKSGLHGKYIMDFYVDIEKILSFANTKNREIEIMGLDGLKSWSGTVAFNKDTLTTQINVEAPTPRQGLLSFIDQPKIPSQPPSWVPADVINYHHVSFDARYTLGQIKKMASLQFGPAAVQKHFKKVDLNLQAFLGIKLNKLLESFDKQIIVLDYGVDLEQKANAVLPQSKLALVLGCENNVVMNKVIDILTPFAEDSGVKRSDKLGFKGFSVKLPNFEGGLFMGHKSIVLSLGSGTENKVLKAISSPSLKENLLNSAKYKSFLKNYKTPDSLFFSYGDQSYNGIVLYQFLKSLALEGTLLKGMEKRDHLFWQEMLNNLPSDKDLEGIFGISFGTAYADEKGLSFKGEIELP